MPQSTTENDKKSEENTKSPNKQVDEMLRFHSNILQSLAEGIYLIRASDGVIVFTNPQFDRMFGYESGELLGKHVSIVNAHGEKDPKEVAATIMTELARTGIWSGEVQNIRKDGIFFWCRASVSTFDHPQFGKIWVSVHEDVTEHKHMEDSLRKSESLFRNYFELGQVGMAITSPEQEWLNVNQHLCEMLGYTKEELTKMTWVELTHPDDLEPDLVQFRRLLCGEIEKYSLDKKFIHKNGNIIYTHLTVACQRKPDKSIEYVIASVADITERKHAENELREKEERLALATLQNGVGIWDWNLITQEMIWDDSMYSLYQIRREDFIGTEEAWRTALHPDDLERGDKEVYDALSGKKPFNTEFRVVWPNSEVRHIKAVAKVFRDEQGTPLRMLGINMDITELRQATNALQESEFRWKFALEGAGAGVLDWSLLNSTVFFSKRWKEMLGFSENEIGNGLEEWTKRIHPGDKAESLTTMQAYLDGKTPDYASEHRVRCKDGSYKWILARGMVVSRREDGKPSRMIGTHTDITARKEAEEQIRNMAFYDPLTQLPNRRLLNDRLEQTIAASKRSGSYGAMIFLDLDNFKSLNDTHGHDAGDLLLLKAALRIIGCVREVDTVGRFGGDEFMVVLNELDTDKAKSATQAAIVAEKIRTALSEPYLIKIQQEGKAETIIEQHCTSSIGVVLFISHETSTEDIIKGADLAMYQAKEAGGNSIRFYDSKD